MINVLFVLNSTQIDLHDLYIQYKTKIGYIQIVKKHGLCKQQLFTLQEV